MAGILLNLLAAAMGGQITRATAFLSRFRQYCPEQRLVVLTDPRFLPLRPDGHGYEVRSVSTGRGPLRPMRRTVWENLHVPRPGALDEIAQLHELADLRGVGCVSEAAGAQGVP